MEKSPFNEVSEKELHETIEHIVHDKLPIASVAYKFLITPAGSKEAEKRGTYGSYEHPKYGTFVAVY